MWKWEDGGTLFKDNLFKGINDNPDQKISNKQPLIFQLEIQSKNPLITNGNRSMIYADFAPRRAKLSDFHNITHILSFLFQIRPLAACLAYSTVNKQLP
jgi:hypothetical protein